MAMNAGITDVLPEKRCNIFDEPSAQPAPQVAQKGAVFVTNVTGKPLAAVTHSKNVKCTFCDRNNHSIVNCKNFGKEPTRSKWKVARVKKLCVRCLESGHSSGDCKSPKCVKCGNSHHMLLHFEKEANPAPQRGEELNPALQPTKQ